MLSTIAALLSALGSAFNGIGVGTQSPKIQFYGQLIWVFSNLSWVYITHHYTDKNLFITYANFLIWALFGTIFYIYQSRRKP